MSFYYLLYLWLVLSAKVPITKITTANELIKDAEKAYKEGHYVLALVKYRYLTNSLQFRDASIQLNLAHCYFMNNDKGQAQKYYAGFVNEGNKTMRSIACQQLGVIAFEQKKYKAALDYFKKSLLANPNNEDSRYNYELVAKLLPSVKEADEPEEEKEESSADKQENQSPSESDDSLEPAQAETNRQQEEEVDEETQKQERIQRKLQQINLTPEKAEMILDAMKNSELQYIQQRKKQSPAKEDRNLPDW